MKIDSHDIFIIGFIGIIVVILIFCTSLFGYLVCTLHSEEEHQIINVTDEDIIIEDGNFYINGPDNKLVEIDLDHNAVFDVSKQSVVYLRFTRNLPYLLYKGSDWRVDGIVKAPGGEE